MYKRQEVEKSTTKEEVNAAFKKAAAAGQLAKVLAYSEEPIVSKDLNGDNHSCTLDALSTDVMDGNLVKVFGWYDNEWGYSSRVVDLTAYIAKKSLVPV